MNERPVMIVAGTRPEVIKLAPVIWSLEKFGVDYYVFDMEWATFRLCALRMVNILSTKGLGRCLQE
jgi:hypothetical protein